MTTTTTADPGDYHHDVTDPGPGLNRQEVRWATWSGRRVVLKSGSGRRRVGLRREATILSAARGIAVPELLRVDEGDHVTTLVLGDLGGSTLASDDPAADGLRAAVGLCRAVAALHRSGWAHGRLTPDHVLVGPSGVRLCSLGAAVALDGSDGATRSVAADRRATLELTLDLLATTRPPRRRPDRFRRDPGRRATAVVQDRLRDGAAAEGDLDGLADALDRLASARPRRRRQVRSAGRPGAPRRPRPGRTAGTALAVAAALAITGVAAAAAGPPHPAGRAGAGARPSAGPSAGCPAVARRTPDVDGDGCGDRLRVSGRTVVLGTTRFTVGSPGDRVEVGDWDCDGTATVLALRPTTGEVFEFRDWAAPGSPLQVTPTATVAGAVALRPQGDRACSRPAVRLDDGSSRLVALAPPAPGDPPP